MDRVPLPTADHIYRYGVIQLYACMHICTRVQYPMVVSICASLTNHWLAFITVAVHASCRPSNNWYRCVHSTVATGLTNSALSRQRIPGLGPYSFCGTHCPCMSLYFTSAIPAHRLWSLVPFKYHTYFGRPSASLTSLAMASCSSTCLSLEWFLPHTAYMIVTLSCILCPSERSMIQLGITGTSMLHP